MGARFNHDAVDLETAKTIARIRKLSEQYGPAEAAKRVGCTKGSASLINNGKRRASSYTALDQLGLRFSKRLCRQCGKTSGIVCKSLLCVLCELIELHKQGVVVIGKDE
jgi:hypothetical protein